MNYEIQNPKIEYCIVEYTECYTQELENTSMLNNSFNLLPGFVPTPLQIVTKLRLRKSESK